MSKLKSLSMLILTFGCILCSEEITVSINPAQPVLTSNFHIGVTHTHGFWEYGKSDAVQRASNLLGQRVHEFSQPVLAGSVTVIDIRAEAARLPKGVYYLHVKGLEKPLVQQMTICRNSDK